MATFNGGRMVALFLCMLFALNVSFAQDWRTVVFYMEDPIHEGIAPEVLDYIDKRNDPLTWETFERDFTPAREGQMAQVERENEARIDAARNALMQDMRTRGDGTSKWYPSWIPLGTAKTSEDSLFKNILTLKGLPYLNGQKQTLREFFELDGDEPDGENFDGSQKYWECDSSKRRCRKEFYADFRALVDKHDASLQTTSSTRRIADEDGCGCQLQAVPDETPSIISFTIRAKSVDEDSTVVSYQDTSFVAELNEEGLTRVHHDVDKQDPYVEFDWASIRLLQPAAMDPNTYVIDTTPYWQPAAKAVSSTETSSWGRIKATFADD